MCCPHGILVVQDFSRYDIKSVPNKLGIYDIKSVPKQAKMDFPGLLECYCAHCGVGGGEYVFQTYLDKEFQKSHICTHSREASVATNGS